MYQQHSLEVFNATFFNAKAWFPPVKLIYFHSLVLNVISNREDVNAYFFIALKIISQISV